MMQQEGAVTEQIYVPDNMVGLLIGRGGENITRMQQESQCKIQMSQDNQGQPTRLCTLTGPPECSKNPSVRYRCHRTTKDS